MNPEILLFLKALASGEYTPDLIPPRAKMLLADLEPKARHSPGPWYIGGHRWLQDGKLYEEHPRNNRGADYYVSVETDDEYIAIVGGDGTQEANASLIASAPEMYDLLQECRVDIEAIAERIAEDHASGNDGFLYTVEEVDRARNRAARLNALLDGIPQEVK